MSLNNSRLAEVQRMFRAIFLKSFGEAARPLERLLSVEIPTTGKELKPKFASRDYGVHEWLDERQYARLRTYDFSIPVRDWANGLMISENDLDDDNASLGVYKPLIQDMADDFREHQYQLLIDLINAGFDGSKGLTYDGQFLFDSDHQDHEDAPSQSNVSTDALSESAVYALMEQMRKIRKPNGLYANIRPTHIIVPPALEEQADKIFKRDFIVDGNTASNTLKGRLTVEVEPRLESDTAWYLLDSTKPLKPLAKVMRKKVQVRRRNRPEDSEAFESGKLKFGADGRYNAGFYFWQAIAGSDGTGG